MKKLLLTITLAALAFIVAGQSRQGVVKDPQPNILFILIDDMGYADLGCFGNTEAQTTAIDRLASEGIRFTQYYASAPICSPSRVAALTGQYPGRWGITSYIDSRTKNKERGMQDFLKADAPSVARILANAGYYTAHIGKWHMGGGRDVGEAPLITEYGFDESLSQFEGLGDRYLATYETLNLKDSTRQLEKWSAQLGRGNIYWEKRYDVTARFVDSTIAAIRKAQDKGKPFYINLWPDDVHTPLEPSPENRGSGSKHDRYMGVVKELDEELGRVFDFIRSDPALSANTIIVLTSDNGPEPGAGSAGPFRSSKGSLYEGGIREPFIVWSPGRIPETRRGTTNSASVVAGIDLAPSFAALAGADKERGFDGLDMSEVLTGKSTPERNGLIFWQRPPDRKMVEGQPQPDLAVREDHFKLLINEDGSGAELYDLSIDPGETNNIAGKHPAQVRKLSSKLLAWHASLPESR